MRHLNLKEISNAAGGIATITSDGLLVTNGSSMTVNGVGFMANGILSNTLTGETFFDFSKETGPFIMQGVMVSATPQDNGYLFTLREC